MFQIESHAVERYIERHVARDLEGRPTMDFQEAYDLLWDHANNRAPTKLKKRTHRGDALWKLSELDVVLVVKFENGINVAVTCIPNIERKHISTEERERIEEYMERIQERERVAREEEAATKNAIARQRAADRLGDPALQKRLRAEAEEAEKNAVAVFRRKMALIGEERGMVRDYLAAIKEQQKHEMNKQHVESGQANRIRQLSAALKLAVGFLVDHKDQHPESANVVLQKIRRINERFVEAEFFDAPVVT
jgi:hypothetical protein